MFKSTALVPTHRTSPWRGHRQLSLSSVSRVKVEGKQFRLAFSAQRLTLWLWLSSTSPPSPSAACLSLTLCSSCRLRSPLLPPQTHSSCGTSRPLLHASLDKTRCSSWVSLGHANDCGCVSVCLPCHIFAAHGGTHTHTHPRCLSLSIPANESGAPWLR